MKKKLIIMIAAAGLISFAGTFAFAWLTKPAPTRPPNEPNQSVHVGRTDQQNELLGPEVDTPKYFGTGDSNPPGRAIPASAGVNLSPRKRGTTMMENQLKNLIYEVQEKMKEYNDKLQSLQTREQRLQMAQETLKKDIENLNNLRIELASTVASLKNERDKLAKSRVEIAQAEKVNLVKIAAAYDKMDSASAGKILTNMCNSQAQSADSASEEKNMNDAVKILHYMSERTKANLLAELANSQPDLAADLCGKLKQITEGK